MNRQQMLRKIEQVLCRRRSALLRSLRGELGQFNTSHERTVGDDADAAVDTDYGIVNSQLAETESRELERIDHALAQIREGRYGLCEACGKSIALTRLQALPYATKCIRCQRSSEGEGEPGSSERDWSRAEDDDNGDPGASPLDPISAVD